MQTATAYNHETVVLDGEEFDGCEFRDCRLVYSGGKAPKFGDCRFYDCDWRFEGAAGETLKHMKAVWNAGGKQVVQALIKEITGGGGK